MKNNKFKNGQKVLWTTTLNGDIEREIVEYFGYQEHGFMQDEQRHQWLVKSENGQECVISERFLKAS